MPLRIAFDLDGVFADMEGALAREAKALFGDAMTGPGGQGRAERSSDSTTPPAVEPAPSSPAANPNGSPVPELAQPPQKLHLTSRQTSRLWRHVSQLDRFWESLDEIEPGAVGHLASIADERRWEVIFLTRRPESAGATSQRQTQRWLESKGFPLPSVFVVQGSRGRIAASLDLDFVIDDSRENCLDVLADSKARAILIWRGEEGPVRGGARRLGIGVARSVDDCLNILREIDGPSQNRPGIVARVLNLLGLGSDESTGKPNG